MTTAFASVLTFMKASELWFFPSSPYRSRGNPRSLSRTMASHMCHATLLGASFWSWCRLVGAVVVGEACTAVGLSKVAEAGTWCVAADFGDPSRWRGEAKEVVAAVPVWSTGTF
jgi:hypothetical protein